MHVPTTTFAVIIDPHDLKNFTKLRWEGKGIRIPSPVLIAAS